MTQYDENNKTVCDCRMETCSVKTNIGFIDQKDNEDQYEFLKYKPSLIKENKHVTGFFGSCILLNAALMTDFTCLYNETCCDLLLGYFPNLTKVLNYRHRNPHISVIGICYYRIIGHLLRKCSFQIFQT
jgi:hypothetical protein